MAVRLLSKNFINSFLSLNISNKISATALNSHNLLTNVERNVIPTLTATRNTSFFNKCEHITSIAIM